MRFVNSCKTKEKTQLKKTTTLHQQSRLHKRKWTKTKKGVILSPPRCRKESLLPRSKHGRQKKDHAQAADEHSTANSARRTWKEDQKIKLPKFICEYIYNWLIIFYYYYYFLKNSTYFFFSRYSYVTSKQSILVLSAQSLFNMQDPPPPPLPIGARPELWLHPLCLQEHCSIHNKTSFFEN